MPVSGQRLDATGLYFYNARYYDPVLGRFIPADPLVPGAPNPQAFNRYSYVLNNPLKYVDPTGLCVTNDPDGSGGYTITRNDPFDCTTDELTGLQWDVRIWWLDLLESPSYANTPDWFNAVQAFMMYLRDNPLFSNLGGWGSYSNAGALLAIQNGYRLFTDRQAVDDSSQGHAAANLWSAFFQARRQPHPDTAASRQAWGAAEQAGVDFGVATANARFGSLEGLPGAVMANLLFFGNAYRWSVSHNVPGFDPRDEHMAQVLYWGAWAVTVYSVGEY